MKHLLSLSLLALIFCSGCICIPTESVTAPITPDELSQHVTYLTQSSLRGRSAGSWQSPHVQDYLSQRLTQYGCVPWADNPSFALDFGFGKNIIAVLPGSDPQLSKQIVLISAHYDHLKPTWFSWYPGACDNGAAVAVLLEIAENLSQQPQRPKRTICFAFFDAEEMGCAGSYAFTCRDDYDDAAIVATVNMDMLGRDLLDVVDHCLIATGTDDYAPLQNLIGAACADNGLKFVPLESDLIGPVGDHTAFTSNRRPVVFFTSGINKDYHQPTDTADKINFQKLKCESAVVKQTLLALANDNEDLFTPSPAPLTSEKVEAFSYILNQFKAHQDTFKLDPNDIQTLDQVIAQTAAIDPNTVTHAELIDIERQSLGKLIGLLKNYNKDLSKQSHTFLEISAYYAVNPQAITDIYRSTVRHYLTHRPSVFGKNEFASRTFMPINKNSWGIVKTEDGDYVFGFIDTEFSFETELQLLSESSFSWELNCEFTACKGPLDEVINFAFWGTVHDPNAIQIEKYSSESLSENIIKNQLAVNNLVERRDNLAAAVLKTIEQVYPEENDNPMIGKLRDPNTLAADPNTSGESCYRLFITHKEKEKGGENKKTDIQRFIRSMKDPSRHPEDRIDWMNYLVYKKTRQSLSAVVDMLDDKTPYRAKKKLFAHEQFPLKYHPIIKQFFTFREEAQKKFKDKTLGQISLDSLKRVTKKDFGTDQEAWKKWIEKHY